MVVFEGSTALRACCRWSCHVIAAAVRCNATPKTPHRAPQSCKDTRLHHNPGTAIIGTSRRGSEGYRDVLADFSFPHRFSVRLSTLRTANDLRGPHSLDNFYFSIVVWRYVSCWTFLKRGSLRHDLVRS